MHLPSEASLRSNVLLSSLHSMEVRPSVKALNGMDKCATNPDWSRLSLLVAPQVLVHSTPSMPGALDERRRTTVPRMQFTERGCIVHLDLQNVQRIATRGMVTLVPLRGHLICSPISGVLGLPSLIQERHPTGLSDQSGYTTPSLDGCMALRLD